MVRPFVKMGAAGGSNHPTCALLSERCAPRAEHEQRLRCAYQTFELLLAEESPHTVRAWLLGPNPQLDDQSPTQSIREGDFRDVLVAAKAFLAGG